ncbi:class I SAM-dependent methyltransferase [Mycobacteroides chelonae]|uniref:class I SAM-dependent methyltransferase n=1 Tax=Mycobacteroides chelonae TaxID=1774 RepID=UPI000AD68C60|nr:class I SAM-dependent methyltransferase [Mycobacteroides chelonae]
MSNERHRWNHNTHYYDIVIGAAPLSARTALDVGTGDGLLAVRLAEKIPEVTGIDSDADVVNLAQSSTSANVSWIIGDALTFALPEAHYDLVAAVATVHHFPDLTAGLQRLAGLTAPGGALVVIGCARSSTLSDYTFDALGVLQHQVLSRARGFWRHNAPVRTQFPHTHTEVKQIATTVLAGMTWRRLPLWRYAITWHKSGVKTHRPTRTATPWLTASEIPSQNRPPMETSDSRFRDQTTPDSAIRVRTSFDLYA